MRPSPFALLTLAFVACTNPAPLPDEGPTTASTSDVERAPDNAVAPAPSEASVPVGYVAIAAGTFEMGAPTNEEGYGVSELQREVSTSALWLKVTEVTQAEWHAVMAATPSKNNTCGACPVENVSWFDATRYVNALSAREGLERCYADDGRFLGMWCPGYRLPSEAEWELAARAGTTGPHYGDALGDVAWFKTNADDTTHPVAQKQPNAFGLYDMLGNVAEWQQDRFRGFNDERFADPNGPSVGADRVVRGGSFSHDTRDVRAADRWGIDPHHRTSYVGLRPARTMLVTVAPRDEARAMAIRDAEALDRLWPIAPETKAATWEAVARLAADHPDEARAAQAKAKAWRDQAAHIATMQAEWSALQPALDRSSATLHKLEDFLARHAALAAHPTYAAAVEAKRAIDGGAPRGYVTIPAGRSPGERTKASKYGDAAKAIPADVARPFWMKATEVTQAEWLAVMGTTVSYHRACPTCPVEQVSCNDAKAYADTLSRREGLEACYASGRDASKPCFGYRLPSGDEWRYAARGGTRGDRYDGLNAIAWHHGNASATQPVATRLPNRWGLYDALGNVWEWTQDPAGEAAEAQFQSGRGCTYRGGSYYYAGELASAATAWGHMSDVRFEFIGFRLARSIEDVGTLQEDALANARREAERLDADPQATPRARAMAWDAVALIGTPDEPRVSTATKRAATWREVDALSETMSAAWAELRLALTVSRTGAAQKASRVRRFLTTYTSLAHTADYAEATRAEQALVGGDAFPLGDGSAPAPRGFVVVPAGRFTMGSPSSEDLRSDDELQHDVRITRPFWLQATEVTQAQWKAITGESPSEAKDCGKVCPVENVSWLDATAYLNALSAREGLEACYRDDGTFKGLGCAGYRLPTEAEWEYAVRAGTTGEAYGPLKAVAWYDAQDVYYGNDIWGSPDPTAATQLSKRPNAWGLRNMLGNVAEWVNDWYGPYDGAAPDAIDPIGPTSGDKRVYRGGSTSFQADGVRAASRVGGNGAGGWIGLRAARSIVDDAALEQALERALHDARERETDDKALPEDKALAWDAVARLQVRGKNSYAEAARTSAARWREQAAAANLVPAPAGFVTVPAGRFVMGTTDAGSGARRHEVRITRPFWLGTTEVTQGQWRALMGDNPSHYATCGDACPVDNVTWHDTVAYLNKLSLRDGLQACYGADGQFVGLLCTGYRLPTEAEWEYAARAGTTADRYAALDDIAWHRDNSSSTPHPVASKAPNAWGLYDMLGNVREWVHDRYAEYGSATTDPIGAAPPTVVVDPQYPSAAKRVLRGGDWYTHPDHVGVSLRGMTEPESRQRYVGFRVARSTPAR